MRRNRILFIGSHPDDIELGCGAYLARIVEDADVKCVTLSPNGEAHISEHFASMELLGVSEVSLWNFETRKLSEQRGEILDALYNLNKGFQPDTVFVHARGDIHQDHGVTTNEAIRAFRESSILGYDVIRSNFDFLPNVFMEAEEKYLDMKLEALAKYESFSHKHYFSPEVHRASLAYWGAIIGRPYAEAFECIRLTL